MRIGTGSLGGKATGLLDVVRIVEAEGLEHPDRAVVVGIPHTGVVATDHFDEFMASNDLYGAALSAEPDDRIAHAFQRGDLPARLAGDLRSIASQVTVPLAVRSSSMLEDALAHPFAGVYATVMLPNNSPSVDQRARRLGEAIKLVYASTFFAAARRYIDSVGKSSIDEKMAVIIQEVVGERHGDRFYPDVSGVARSFNFYAFGHGSKEDGVVDLALGLGRTIVDGWGAWSYCPAYPKSPPPYKGIGEMLKHTQRRFWAVDMGPSTGYDPTSEEEHLVHAELEDADYDGTLRMVASTYVAASDRIVPGTGQDGPRLIDFAPLLQLNDIPLNDAVLTLLKVCKREVGADVEIEFAARLSSTGKPSLSLLQVRPMAVGTDVVDVSTEDLEREGVFIASERVLGNGARRDIRDIVYVRPGAFEPRASFKAAQELERANARLAAEGRYYLLIGFGRFGTTDPWRGIPVDWGQISSARVIVEAELGEVSSDFSQGSHFFHNMTSFQVSYFCATGGANGRIDWEWLERQEAIETGDLVRHVRTASPLEIRVDGRSGRGVVEVG